jgi:hypothetical protein
MRKEASMAILKWSLTLGLSFLFGVLYVQYLTVHPVKMSRYQLGAILSLFGAVILLAIGFRGLGLVVGLAASSTCALFGYALMTRNVLSRQDPRRVPDLTRKPDDPGLGHTAVVYFTHGEPETYDPIGWINQFREFDEHGIRFVPYLARPHFLHHLRQAYLAVGKSEHRGMHMQMLKSLERLFREEGDVTTRFYLCFLDDDPRPDAAVVQALNEGASRIVISEVFLTISNHTAEGRELIQDLPLGQYQVPVQFTGPLWDSDILPRMFVARADAHLGGTDKAEVGVLLVGHGQPGEWDKAWPTETAQEIRFREKVLELFQQDGYRAEHLSLAWMEFRDPKPAVKMEEFARDAVTKILYFSAAISADALHSQYDVPHLIDQARVPDKVEVINLGAWNDDPLVIRAIKAKIDASLT